MKYKLLTTILMLIFMTGCNILSPKETPVISKYTLNALPRSYARHADDPSTILVLRPQTNSLYNTTKIMYYERRHQLKSYAVNEWAKTPSQMLQPLIVQTLVGTDYFNAVVTPSFVGNYQYVLSTQIAMLAQDFTQVPAIVRLSVHTQLVQMPSNKVISARVINCTQTMREASPECGVDAANRATARMLKVLARFTIDAVEQAAQQQKADESLNSSGEN